ncbi:Mariner Mos1 transposase [Eumeta japonica]|uniref:Mariner Mos1 transposase n=1 Tax=Eumeta variegata TaxID=151549 RepID=A0A4C1VKX3_EUMVA|nr:Mariner Mos1 transposase [Eumeta japonica]
MSKKQKTTERAKDVEVVGLKQSRMWFQKFKNGDFDIEDKDRSKRPKTYEDTELEELLEEDLSQTQKELALTLEVTQQAVSHRLKSGSDVKNYLKTLDWAVLPHPPYSPDIVLSDYNLFQSMAHALSEQWFPSYEDTKNWVDSWIASKDKEFFRLGIRTLPERWKKVISGNGQYFD